ncbi:hypothetical protein [Aquihabitans sp. McL0605]|uniref:hypothetical protein n=1 Tax=Aquihabitans sp. McL0605 TaxID=3415671 RepID=UPI003CF2692D
MSGEWISFESVLAQAEADEAERLARVRRHFVLRHLAEAAVLGVFAVDAVAGWSTRQEMVVKTPWLMSLSIGSIIGSLVFAPVLMALVALIAVRLVVCVGRVIQGLFAHDLALFDRAHNQRHLPGL